MKAIRIAVGLLVISLLAACELLTNFDRSLMSTSDDSSTDASGDAALVDGSVPLEVDAALMDAAGAEDGGPPCLPPGPLVPDYLDASLIDPDASSLRGVVGIDTAALTLDLGEGGAPPPGGVRFVAIDGPPPSDGGWWPSLAVLTVNDWTVDAPVAVTGTRSLVVLAAGRVDVGAVIDCAGRAQHAGPGGYDAGTSFVAECGPGCNPGAGVGGGGFPFTGGGGAGHATPGAAAGESGPIGGGDPVTCLHTGNFGCGGPAYSLPLIGGSAGGALGGGGGGAVMIFSRTTINVTSAGGISAGGGGGSSGGGGGGGSGGFVLLEAPGVSIHGVIAANGGGGEGTTHGSDGLLSTAPAPGGLGLACDHGDGGGNGGALAGPTPALFGDMGITPGCGIYGGGGAAGIIVVRTRGTPDVAKGVISPHPTLDHCF